MADDVGGYVDEFCRWLDLLSDCPRPFAEATALFTVSAIARNKVRVEWSAQPDTPVHEWFFLLGDTASRKSFALGKGLKMLQEVLPEGEFSAEHSPEAFLQELSEHQGLGYLAVDEVSKLFGDSSDGGYRHGLIEVYNQSWGRDTPQKRRTQKGGEVVVPRSFLPIIVATTDDALRSNLAGKHLSLGFLQRFVLVHGKVLEERPPGQVVVGAEEQQVYVKERLLCLKKWVDELERPLTLGVSKEALHLLWGTYAELHEELKMARGAERSAASRFQEHALRIAALYDLAEHHTGMLHSDTRDISARGMARALQLLRGSVETWRRFAPYAEDTPFAGKKRALLDELERLGKPVKEVMFRDLLDITPRDYEAVVQVLEDAGKVVRRDGMITWL